MKEYKPWFAFVILFILSILGHLQPYFARQGRNFLGMPTIESCKSEPREICFERALLAAELAQLPEMHPTANNEYGNEGK